MSCMIVISKGSTRYGFDSDHDELVFAINTGLAEPEIFAWSTDRTTGHSLEESQEI
ncbi:hypothetical protein PGT21_027653 [Puccinia graminis f. sp. tritici]|uniref:Uncharacterized protein n=1 Tax=Puccinia graminis f. sp. tritici TaxID=56615 RepID=A0A5B0PHA7_PUCGR|nr:hypothetical protein PGT21_027653 [Puccinia graminis f. sp. tritici]KAA1128082.1 hypothetical protein PGTUg99_004598 [Puccinia graminis f. sp. tritici]